MEIPTPQGTATFQTCIEKQFEANTQRDVAVKIAFTSFVGLRIGYISIIVLSSSISTSIQVSMLPFYNLSPIPSLSPLCLPKYVLYLFLNTDPIVHISLSLCPFFFVPFIWSLTPTIHVFSISSSLYFTFSANIDLTKMPLTNQFVLHRHFKRFGAF